MAELLHLRHAIMQSCIRMGCASCRSQESLFVISQWCAAVVKPFGAPDPAAVYTCFVTALMLFRAQALLRADWCPMGWMSECEQ